MRRARFLDWLLGPTPCVIVQRPGEDLHVKHWTEMRARRNAALGSMALLQATFHWHRRVEELRSANCSARVTNPTKEDVADISAPSKNREGAPIDKPGTER
jgi:hypothetical protein